MSKQTITNIDVNWKRVVFTSLSVQKSIIFTSIKECNK